jgi:hypothetical protein
MSPTSRLRRLCDNSSPHMQREMDSAAAACVQFFSFIEIDFRHSYNPPCAVGTVAAHKIALPSATIHVCTSGCRLTERQASCHWSAFSCCQRLQAPWTLNFSKSTNIFSLSPSFLPSIVLTNAALLCYKQKDVSALTGRSSFIHLTSRI